VISRIVALVLAAELSALAVVAEKQQPIEVYFSPGASCTEAIVRELSNAKLTVHVQAYSFTSQPIARALTDAEKRGVKVIAILDASIEPRTIQRPIFSRIRALRRTSIQCTRLRTIKS
jgi:phosphatidylserine/phosphatidylglycerophosphate/cardiolipin synthase-like enzyme